MQFKTNMLSEVRTAVTEGENITDWEGARGKLWSPCSVFLSGSE
jgi:hypothetical protein